MFNRVIIKLSGEYLSGEHLGAESKRVDYPVSDGLVKEIASVMDTGIQTGLVVGGGNFWRGRDASPDFSRDKADGMGMLASVMNGVFLAERFARLGIWAHVMTPFPVGGFTEMYNRDLAENYLITPNNTVIFAGGTGQPYFSTDTITVIRAADLRADMTLFAKAVPGVCDRDPKKAGEGGYALYREITASKMLDDKLSAVDFTAMTIARDMRVNCALFDIREENAVRRACAEDGALMKIGTIIKCE
ncbi:MAG: UMP kinase [Clostridiales bacterium]|jgi:uridylate kinase|nr:UMP kinase [Clostridiales bacterium]